MPAHAKRTILRRSALTVTPILAAALLMPVLATVAASSPAAPAGSGGSGKLTGCLEDGRLTKVKKGSKPTSKCKNGERTVTWNKEGDDGDRGPAGANGSPGAPGTPGTPGSDGTDGIDGTDGAPGISGYAVRNFAVVAANPIGFQTLAPVAGDLHVTSCQTGERVISGGWTNNANGAFNPITTSAPNLFGTAWVIALEAAPAVNTLYFVVCANVTP